MTRTEYVDRVLSVMKHVTGKERDAIRTEIDAHIEDHICGLLELDYPEDLAEERTMARMGDPEEVGRELDKQYPLRWLIIGRIAKALLTLTVICAVLGSISLIMLADSLLARTVPWVTIPGAWEKELTMRVDIKEEIGSDVLRILGTGTGGEGCIVFCQYDQNLFGYTSNLSIRIEDCRGEPIMGGSMGKHSSGSNRYFQELDLQQGAPYITVVCERYGERHEIQVPLKWEGDA